MTEFIASLADLPRPVILFMMGMSCIVALFYTIIIRHLYEIKVPRWFFFVLNPLLIALGYKIYKPLGGGMFIILFLLTFVLGITGMIYASIRDYVRTVRQRDKAKKKKTPHWKIVLHIVAGFIFIMGFFSFGPLTIIVLIAYVLIVSILPGNKDNMFLHLQQTLPTSNIRSMAMGLVEVEGTIQLITPVLAPMNNKKCIGYRYTVESVSNDSDGKKSYHTVEDKTVCMDFLITDKTGEVKVKGEDLDTMWIPLDLSKEAGGYRRRQYLLLEGNSMLLIGMASLENNEPVICREPIKNVFMIAPSDSVNRWNKYLPLLHSFAVAAILIAAVSALILLADIRLEDGIVHVSLKALKFNWGNLF